MDNSSNISQPQGFNPQVIDQPQQIAMASPPADQTRGQHRFGRGRPSNTGIQTGRETRQAVTTSFPGTQQSWSAPQSLVGTNSNAFAPLGSSRQQHTRQHYSSINPQFQQSHTQYQKYQSQQHLNQIPYQQPSQNTYSRGRDGYSRGRGNNSRQHQHSQLHTQSHGGQRRVVSDDYSRPAPQPANGLYSHNHHSHYGTHDQQRSFRHRLMVQSDFLASLASQNLKNQITQEELMAKEAFRKRIQLIAQKAVAALAVEPESFNPADIRLRLYGSLGSGFAVTGSDMDLLLVFPKHGTSQSIEIESRRLFEKALLDEDIGARLLTNTRVPILKVCESPHPALLAALRENRADWDYQESGSNSKQPDLGNDLLPELSLAQEETVALAFASLDLEIDAASIPLPASPVSEQARLEFSGECGIQCDINFANHVALHNTELLRLYGTSDSRVRQMGIFVKNWAKARDINTPYLGTLSSYGYILMVLHYLMNIAHPPVIPNLQHIQVSQDQWKAEEDVIIPRVEGFDVRFVRDPEEIQRIKQDMPRNHDSLGALLRGFFQYYSSPQGFHWGRDVISIRTPGGKVSKQSKGWTEAKWADQSPQAHVRLRYLFAIEDPFEIEHNVARTVGHHGIVAIRDEFRRAWSIIDSVGYDTIARTYSWTNGNERQDATQLMEHLTDRGDLLRKDQNFRKEKMRRMRQEAEAKEQALKRESLQDTASVSGVEAETNGTWMDEPPEMPYSPHLSDQDDWSNQQLMHDPFQNKSKGWRSKMSRRYVESDRNTSDEYDDGSNQHKNMVKTQVSPDGPNSTSQHEMLERKSQASDVDEVLWSMRQEVMSQRQTHFYLIGDRIFARDKKADAHLEPHNRPLYSQKKLGSLIPWDKQTEAGRWLLWRDRQICAGKDMKFTDPVLKVVDEEFPYSPGMTYAELAVFNERLRKHYAKSLIRINDSLVLIDTSDGTASSIADPGLHVQEEGLAKNTGPLEEFENKSRPVSSPEQVTDIDEPVALSVSSPAAEVSPAPDVERLRAKQTQYYSQQMKEQESHDGEAVKCTTRVVESPKESSPPYGRSAVQRGSKHIEDKHTRNQESGQSSTDNKLSHQQRLLSLLNTQATPPAFQQAKADRKDQQIDDINTELTYLLQRAGYQFDSRQLADLDIIRRGGNGCVRNGQAFAVEEDYELSGGGAMASKSSTGRRCVSDSGIVP